MRSVVGLVLLIATVSCQYFSLQPAAPINQGYTDTTLGALQTYGNTFPSPTLFWLNSQIESSLAVDPQGRFTVVTWINDPEQDNGGINTPIAYKFGNGGWTLYSPNLSTLLGGNATLVASPTVAVNGDYILHAAIGYYLNGTQSILVTVGKVNFQSVTWYPTRVAYASTSLSSFDKLSASPIVGGFGLVWEAVYNSSLASLIATSLDYGFTWYPGTVSSAFNLTTNYLNYYNGRPTVFNYQLAGSSAFERYWVASSPNWYSGSTYGPVNRPYPVVPTSTAVGVTGNPNGYVIADGHDATVDAKTGCAFIVGQQLVGSVWRINLLTLINGQYALITPKANTGNGSAFLTGIAAYGGYIAITYYQYDGSTINGTQSNVNYYVSVWYFAQNIGQYVNTFKLTNTPVNTLLLPYIIDNISGQPGFALGARQGLDVSYCNGLLTFDISFVAGTNTPYTTSTVGTTTVVTTQRSYIAYARLFVKF